MFISTGMFTHVSPGAKFRKYVGHSAHVTNVRFSNDFHRVISVGGGDHAVFQWRFLPEGVQGDDEDLPETPSGYLESDSEDSDSEASDIAELDSDVENVSEMSCFKCCCCMIVSVCSYHH